MASESDVAPPRLFRRYGNRKLYDVQARQYATLDQLARLVARGQEITVVERKSGEDLTSPILAQVLLEQIKHGAGRIPRQLLTRLIRLAAGQAAALRPWPEPREAAGRARRETERIVARFLGRGKLSLDDALSLRHQLGQLVHQLVADAQSGVEARLRALVEHGESAAGRSMQALRGRIRSFERYLDPPAATRLARGKRKARTGGR